MSTYIGGTIGLECTTPDGHIRLVRVEFYLVPQGIKLQAVSGQNLASFGPRFSKTITQDDYDDRPRDPYAGTTEAIWAMALVGLRPTRFNSVGSA